MVLPARLINVTVDELFLPFKIWGKMRTDIFPGLMCVLIASVGCSVSVGRPTVYCPHCGQMHPANSVQLPAETQPTPVQATRTGYPVNTVSSVAREQTPINTVPAVPPAPRFDEPNQNGNVTTTEAIAK
jgi:hypothetical protein